jgi:hypothetical protein
MNATINGSACDDSDITRIEPTIETPNEEPKLETLLESPEISP